MLKIFIKQLLGYSAGYERNCKGRLWGLIQENLKRFWLTNVDHACRYVPILEYLNKKAIYATKILDVGSGSIGLSCYCLKQLVGLDLTFDGPKLRNLVPVLGSGCQMPFRDAFFDAVVAVDLLEHLEPEKRRSCITEIVRVSKGLVILGFPDGNKAYGLDVYYKDIFKKRTGKDHPFLKEHFKYGLPERGEIEKDLICALDKYGWQYSLEREGNFNLRWLKLLTYFMAGRGPGVSFLTSKCMAPFMPFFMRGLEANTYRTMIYVQKRHN